MQANLSDILADPTITLDHGMRFRFLIDVAQVRLRSLAPLLRERDLPWPGHQISSLSLQSHSP